MSGIRNRVAQVARKKTSSKSKTPKEEEIPDAEIISETEPATDPDVSDGAEEQSDANDDAGPNEPSEETETQKHEPDAQEAASESTEEPAPEIEDIATEEVKEASLSTSEPRADDTFTTAPRSGFLPTLLGGVLAAGIGFAAAIFAFPEGGLLSERDNTLETQIAEQSRAIEALTKRLDDAPADTGIDALNGKLSEHTTILEDLALRIAVSENLAGELDKRITVLESRPVGEGVSAEGLAKYDEEIRLLQETLAAQRAEVEALTSTGDATLAEAGEALRRAAMTRIQTALDSGLGFASAVEDLKSVNVSVSEVLEKYAPNGVPTQIELQESFPDAARAALAIARASSTAEGDTGGFTGFLRAQLGARSLEPKEGNDPDAILSRAEAAVRDGRLSDALAEISSLPEDAQAALSQWSAEAASRLETVAAARALSEKLN